MKFTTSQLKSLIKESVKEVMKEHENFKMDFKTPDEAFEWAVENGEASDVSRFAASEEPALALDFALEIDEAPHEDTRKGASKDAYHALQYALHVDKKAHPVTYAGVKEDSKFAKIYAKELGLPKNERYTK